METVFHTSLVVLTALYTALAMLYARIFSRGDAEAGSLSRPLLAGTVALHFGSIALRGKIVQACPLGTPGEFLSLLAASIALIYLLLELRLGVRTTGVFALAPTLLLQLVATVRMLGESPVEPLKLGVLRSLHSFATVAAFSGVAFSGIYGVLYLALYGAIKAGRFGVFFRKMPPLETLGDLHFAAVRLAFFALTAAVALGAWMLASLPQPAVSARSAEVLAASALWLFFGAAIAARKVFSLGGKRLAYGTVLASLILAALVVGGFVTGTFHR